MDRIFKDKKAYLIFILPPLLIFILTVLIPIVWSLVYALFSWDGITPMRFVRLDNFRKMLFADEIFWIAVKNNLLYTLMCVVLKTVVGMSLALLLTAQKQFRELFKTMYFIPAILSTVVVSQLFQRVYSLDPEGLLNALLRIVGLGHYAQAWLSYLPLVLFMVALVDMFKYVPIYMIIFYSALISIPRELVEAAQLDGAQRFKMFFSIKLPLIKTTVVAALIMMLAGTLKEFDIPYLLTGGGPGHATEMVTTHMYKVAFSSMQYGYGSAIAFFIAIECLALVLIFRSSILKGAKD